jgi:hypothetical protein
MLRLDVLSAPVPGKPPRRARSSLLSTLRGRIVNHGCCAGHPQVSPQVRKMTRRTDEERAHAICKRFAFVRGDLPRELLRRQRADNDWTQRTYMGIISQHAARQSTMSFVDHDCHVLSHGMSSD